MTCRRQLRSPWGPFPLTSPPRAPSPSTALAPASFTTSRTHPPWWCVPRQPTPVDAVYKPMPLAGIGGRAFPSSCMYIACCAQKGYSCRVFLPDNPSRHGCLTHACRFTHLVHSVTEHAPMIFVEVLHKIGMLASKVKKHAVRVVAQQDNCRAGSVYFQGC